MCKYLSRLSLTADYSLFISAVEDFSSRSIPFIIPANSTKPAQDVVIVVNDDNKFEPVEEGFRLVLLVNESMTPLSLVTFGLGRQVALFRIDDLQDSKLHVCCTNEPVSVLPISCHTLWNFFSAFTVGFKFPVTYLTEITGITTLGLPLVVEINDTTEIPITLTFSLGSESNATEDLGMCCSCCWYTHYSQSLIDIHWRPVSMFVWHCVHGVMESQDNIICRIIANYELEKWQRLFASVTIHWQ